MNSGVPAAYCFFQDIEPRPAWDAVFDHDYLLHAVNGALRVRVNKARWLLPPSFAAWVPANTPISVEINDPVTACSVLSEPAFCPAMPRTPTVFQMSPMARLMVNYCKDWGADSDHPAEAQPFFSALLNVCAGLATKSIDVEWPTASDQTLQRAIDLTEAQLAEQVTASEISREIGLSERSMQRRFRENVGMTWSESLTRLRMIEAVRLLADGELSIIQISGDVGFGSISAFNRAFRTFADCTPTEFRKALKK